MSAILTPDALRQLFANPFDANEWTHLLAELFPAATLLTDPIPFAEPEADGSQGFYLGDVDLRDHVRLAFYRFTLPGRRIGRSRVGLRRLAKKMKDQAQDADAVLAVFDGQDGWRLSLVSDIAGLGKGLSPKRFTFLLGRQGENYRTPVERFSAFVASDGSFAALRDAFSVEALTKQFYRDLFEWFTWAVSEDSHITFPSDTTTEDDDREDIETKVIRMITRIIFVWFIKQKDLVPARIFDQKYVGQILSNFDPESRTVGDYYCAILQNLFFATLNRAIRDEKGECRRFATGSKRDIKTLYRYEELFSISQAEVIELFSEVPFLNGGLFECLDKTRTHDGVDHAFNYDGFSRNDKTFPDGRYKNRAVVPNALFFLPEKGLFEILARYNFTIEENTPDDQKVALDPELLGKVFENLLGAYNPETKETARNQSGSFYTPRPIVNFMVDESLRAFAADSPLLANLLDHPDFIPATDDPDHLAGYLALAERLRNLRLLDPACGSGAFPMGVMTRLVDILCRISPEANPYELKLSVIDKCIFGSDIQCIAIQITKLRFFISLICDCERDPQKPNFGIPTLPNLETKFVAADSLTGKKKHEEAHLFTNKDIEDAKRALIRIRHEHFTARSASRKTALRQQDEALRASLAQMLAADNNFAPADAQQLAEWNPYDQNAVAPFFDPEWMFGVEGGFDVVIGNPPYVQLQANGGELAKRYEPMGYRTLTNRGDLYCLFLERGHQLLRQGGHLCFITSNKWMRAGYGEKTRAFLAAETDPQLLVDFAGVKVFESATVDTNILLFARAANQGRTLATTVGKTAGAMHDLRAYVSQNATPCAFAGADSWVILSPIEQSIRRKIEAVGTPLKDWDVAINYGIKTGLNEAFIVSTEQRDAILAACRDQEERTRTEALIRPILRGRDIKRYGYEWKDLYVILAYYGIYKIMEKEYPTVYNYLCQFEAQLKKRGQCRYTSSGKAKEGVDFPGQHHWLELDNNPSLEKLGDFEKQKVMWKIIGCNINFSFDDNKMICNNAVNIMVGKREQLLQFVGLMNSTLFDWYLKLTTEAEVQGGGIQLYVTTLEKTLVKLDFDDAFSEIIEKRTKGLVSDKEIDEAVCNVYGLTDDEREFIEQRRSLTLQ